MAHAVGIGRSLREARVARGLALETIEGRTKIRARYLSALEDERFGELPGEAYARGFLRTYADHLGLDGHELLAQYRARARAQEEAAVVPRPQRPYEPRRIGPALAGLAAAVALVVSSLAAWQLGDEPGTGVAEAPSATPPPARAQPAPTAPAVLAITATKASPLQVRLGGPSGRRVWSGTLRPGRPLRLGLSRPLWLRTSAPRNLRLVVAGEPRRLPAGSAAVVVTGRGVRPV